MRALLLACVTLCVWTTQSMAKVHAPRIIDCDMRGCSDRSWIQPQQTKKHHRQANRDRRKSDKVSRTVTIVGHPDGCPRTAFCGCGVAVKVFGKPIRDLWLAANWFKFKTVEAAAGMVAVRRHHVYYIIEVVRHGVVLAYDPNSGQHKTRIHLRSLAGYRVVDPRSS